MASDPARRIGRPVKYVTGRDGKPIPGFSLHKSTDTYYATHSDPREYFGKDFDRALILFREWESKQKGERITIVNPEPSHRLLPPVAPGAPPAIVITDVGQWSIPEELFWAEFRRRMSEPGGPQLCAQKSGFPLDRLHQFNAPPKPLPLADVWTLYEGKEFKYPRQKYDAKIIWQIFSDAVGRSVVDDISSDDLLRYQSALKGRKYAARTFKNHVRTIQSIFNHAWNVRKDHRPMLSDLKHDIRNICKIPTQKEPQPKPMDIDNFKALLEVASTKWRSILLSSLNLGLHGTEMAEMEKVEMNLKRGEFISNRTKTGVARVAKLWTRTIDAIREYQRTDEYRRNASPLLFLNNDGNPYTIQRINEQVQRYRKKAGLGSDVVFDGIRDLFRRAAGVKNFVATKWIMGHSLGIDDVYGFRDVEETAETLHKVEQYVFGNEAEKVDAQTKGT